MNKSNQHLPVHTDAQNDAIGTRMTVPSDKRIYLRTAWVLALCLSVAGWIAVALLSEKTTRIDAEGFLHEPLFGLVPLSYFFLFLAVVLALFDMGLSLRKHR